jgi:predicted DCC family thiol-disulfide oxidoreductase YuxK
VKEAPVVVVFDGVCVLCSGWTSYLLRRDHDRKFRFATTQSDAGRNLLEAHGINPADPSTFLLLRNGRGYTASDALIQMFMVLGGVWRAAALGRVVPRIARDLLYRVLARNRYRWFGRRSTCYAPAASDRDRFLS